MSRFYDLFEQVSRDICQGIVPLIRDRLSPEIDIKKTNLELECRFKTASNEKFRGMTARALRTRRDFNLTPRTTQIRDENYDARPYTLRNSKPVGYGEGVKYLKMKFFPRKDSQLQRAISFFEEMGMKLSFSLEIQDDRLFDEKFRRLGPSPSPFTRVKARTSYVHLSSETSLDMTRVIENERYGFEIEADRTIPLETFLDGDSQGMVKQFLGVTDMIGREIVYQSRTPLPFPLLEESLTMINGALGFEKRDDKPTYKIQKLVPQVRNLRITDLLKEGYEGYAVTPKADGYRYFMVIMKNFIVLVQPPNIYKVIYEGVGIPEEWVGFVFDGELVERENWRTENLSPEFTERVDHYYCIFDVLGYPRSGFPDVERADILRRINRLKTYFEEIRRAPRGAFSWDKVLDLIYVRVRDNLRLPSLTTAIEIKPYDDAKHSPWAAANSFFETLRPKLRYHDDGLILTPLDRSYRELNEHLSLKWKPEELLSIDFQYGEGGELMVVDGDKPVPFNGTRLFPLSGKPSLTNVTEKLVEGGIYEFVYEPRIGKFRFTRARPDKGMPNKLSDASRVWTDVHMPLSSDLLRGVGSSGMRECLREGLWSWISQLRSSEGLRNMSVIVDLSNINPIEDFPIRALEEGFVDLFEGVVVYREDTSTRRRLDFPKVATLPQNMESHVDVLILDGVQFSILEGRPLTYHPRPEQATNFVERVTRLLPHVRYVFVRGVCSVETDEFFVPEMQHDQEKELVIKMIEERGVLEVEYRDGGLFPYSLSKMVAYPRALSKAFPCISAGHRLRLVGGVFQDNGPENILGNPRQGRLWDFLYNVLIPGEKVEAMIPRLSLPTPPDVLLLEQLLSKTTLDQPTLQTEGGGEREAPGPLTEAGLRILLGSVEVARERLEPLTLEPITSTLPENGDLLTMICKAVYGLRSLEFGPNYDPILTETSGKKLQTLFPPTLDIEKLIEEIFSKLGLAILFLRRTLPGLSATSFQSTLIKPELGRPRFGFLLVESLPSGLSLTAECRLLAYRGNVLIHPSDPLIPILFSQPLKTILLDKQSALSPSRQAKIKAKTFGEDKSWSSIHRLFITAPYLQVSEKDPLYPHVKEFVEIIRGESTDNKAMYLVTQKIPRRFEKQTWAKELQMRIEWAVSKGIKPVDYERDFETHIRNFIRSVTITDKAKGELKQTGSAFLFDDSLPGNVYGIAYMNIRSTL